MIYLNPNLGKRGMQAGTEAVMRDWATLVLIALGITVEPHMFIGGLAMAVAGAGVARAFSPERDRRELWLTFSAAIVFAVVAAEVASAWMTGFPPQLAMFAGGFSSRYLAGFLTTALTRAERRGGDLTDRIINRVLPEKKDGDE